MFSSVQHNRFVSDSKGKEPDVLFIGDSLIQLLHEFEVQHSYQRLHKYVLGFVYKKKKKININIRGVMVHRMTIQ